MRTLTLSIIVSAMLPGRVEAQIPNHGFEDWRSVHLVSEPTFWYDPYSLLDSTGSYSPVSRSTDHYPRIQCSPGELPEPVQRILYSWVLRKGSYSLATTVIRSGPVHVSAERRREIPPRSLSSAVLGRTPVFRLAPRATLVAHGALSPCCPESACQCWAFPFFRPSMCPRTHPLLMIMRELSRRCEALSISLLDNPSRQSKITNH